MHPEDRSAPSLVELYVFDSDYVTACSAPSEVAIRTLCGHKRNGELFVEYEDEFMTSKAKRDCINFSNGTNSPSLDMVSHFSTSCGPNYNYAHQTIIMHAIFRIMASAHVLEQFWNGKHSHCPVGPFWNILERQLLPFRSRTVW